MTDWAGSAPPPEDWGETDAPRRNWLASRGYLATSKLYPIDIVDGLSTAFRLPSRLSTFRQPVDPLGTAFRLPASGDLRQTYFPRNENVNDTQFLSTAFRLPPVGNLGTTYYPHYVAPRETQHLSTAFRLPSSGNLDTGILVTLEDVDNLNTAFRLPSAGDLS